MENKEPKGKCAVCASNKRDHRLLAGKLDVYDWLNDVPESALCPNIVEIKFKNTRKGFYANTNQLRLERGDVVAVEASPGHDIGIVSLTGDLVMEQMRKQKLDPKTYEAKKVYRKAKPVDIEKWHEAIALEHKTMIKARQISADLRLDMKIGDVE
jgi:cell fate regulator YaaT (PSP1 superfamily)